jgi:hypothetical protein
VEVSTSSNDTCTYLNFLCAGGTIDISCDVLIDQPLLQLTLKSGLIELRSYSLFVWRRPQHQDVRIIYLLFHVFSCRFIRLSCRCCIRYPGMRTVLEGYASYTFFTMQSLISISEHLRGSDWDNKETIEHAKQNFERNAKRKVKAQNDIRVKYNNNIALQFDSADKHSWVQLIGFKSDAKLGIQRGRLQIPRYEHILTSRTCTHSILRS